MPVRIAIIEDDPLLLESLELLLSREPDVSVVGAYRSAEDALQFLQKASPEMILTDLGLPGMSGIDLIKKVKEDMPRLEIMVHTVFDETEKMLSAIKAGASGYFLKGTGPPELIEAIRGLYNGRATMTPNMAQKIIKQFESQGVDCHELLTIIETTILGCIAEGMTPRQIAAKSGMSPNAIGECIKSIYETIRKSDSQSLRSGHS